MRFALNERLEKTKRLLGPDTCCVSQLAFLTLNLSWCCVRFSCLPEMYPKPFFKTWASPVVTPGTRVTFNCSTPRQHMSFILYKDGSEIASSDRSWASPGASAAHFLIVSAGAGDGGNYSCRYYDFSIWSEPSDPVELVVTGQEWGNPGGGGPAPGTVGGRAVSGRGRCAPSKSHQECA